MLRYFVYCCHGNLFPRPLLPLAFGQHEKLSHACPDPVAHAKKRVWCSERLMLGTICSPIWELELDFKYSIICAWHKHYELKVWIRKISSFLAFPRDFLLGFQCKYCQCVCDILGVVPVGHSESTNPLIKCLTIQIAIGFPGNQHRNIDTDSLRMTKLTREMQKGT